MTAPLVVAGGGLAGAAAACLLARAGKRVLLFERMAGPAPKICGEFVSAEAQRILARLGADPAALGAHRIDRLRLVRGASVVEAALPFAGYGLSRRVLDEALLRAAAGAGADIRRGHAVALARSGDPVTLDIEGMGEMPAAALFLATGKHDLRGARRRPGAEPEELVGFKTHLRLADAQSAALAGCVELILLPDGYAGLQRVEGGRANLCLLTQRSRLQRAGGEWDGLLRDLLDSAPHLRTRLEGAAPLDARPLSIYRVPYGFVHAPAAEDAAGVFRLGDQMGVIHSFTGDGMSIALHSATAAAAAYLAGQPAEAYHRRMRRDVGGQIRRASALYGLARSAPGLLMRLGAAWPSGLSLAAALTRVPAQALRREAA